MTTKLTVDDIKALAYYIKKESKMKEMYLKGRYFGKCLDMCYEEEYYGNFGELTDMTYEDGSPLHTGDIVELRCKDGSIMGHRIVAQTKQRYGVIGVASNKFINGESGSWRIKLVCKYYNNNETKVGNIIIKTTNNDQFIQLEGGKLNITKCKELGLFVEDKKVFTVDKDCDIKCEDYEVFSTSSLFNEDRLTIIRKNGIEIVRLVKPTSDKVRLEFAYYGIEVDVK